jgi:hypothetical protein
LHVHDETSDQLGALTELQLDTTEDLLGSRDLPGGQLGSCGTHLERQSDERGPDSVVQQALQPMSLRLLQIREPAASQLQFIAHVSRIHGWSYPSRHVPQ